jgi:mannose-6-phosphate isomerase-like protein (cupin superfamily)
MAGGSNKYSVAHIEILPGKASLKHFHPEVEESYYIIEGTPRMVINDEVQIVKPGQIVAIPPKATHQIFNDTDKTLHFLALCVPAWTPDCSVFCHLQ